MSAGKIISFATVIILIAAFFYFLTYKGFLKTGHVPNLSSEEENQVINTLRATSSSLLTPEEKKALNTLSAPANSTSSVSTAVGKSILDSLNAK